MHPPFLQRCADPLAELWQIPRPSNSNTKSWACPPAYAEIVRPVVIAKVAVSCQPDIAGNEHSDGIVHFFGIKVMVKEEEDLQKRQQHPQSAVQNLRSTTLRACSHLVGIPFRCCLLPGGCDSTTQAHKAAVKDTTLTACQRLTDVCSLPG